MSETNIEGNVFFFFHLDQEYYSYCVVLFLQHKCGTF